MNNASTADGRAQDGPNNAEPFFPSEGTFNPVVPLSEIGRTNLPAPLPAVNRADVGRPAEAAWAREAHRADWREEEETTLVPARGSFARGARRSWVATAAVITLSVMTGLASGAYLIWSSERGAESQQPAQVAAEAPTLPPPSANAATPATVAEVEEAKAIDGSESKAVEDDKASKAAKTERSREVARPAPTPRAERSTRAAVEAREVTPAPKSARSQRAASARPRVTTAERRSPTPALPVSSPPPSAKSSKVIQWP